MSEPVELPCFNPECSNTITMTKEQKRRFLITWALHYDATVLPTCSKECAEKLLQQLGGNYDAIAQRARDAAQKMQDAR